MERQILNKTALGDKSAKLLCYLKKHILFQDRALRTVVRAISHGNSPLRDDKQPITSLLFLGPSGVGKTETVHILAEFLFGNRNCVTKIDCSKFYGEHTMADLVGSPKGYVGYDDDPVFTQSNIDRHAISSTKNEIRMSSPEVLDITKEIYALYRRIKEMRASKDFDIDNIEELIKKTESLMEKREFIIEEILKEKKTKMKSIILFDEIEKAHPKIWNILLQILDDGFIQLSNGEETFFSNSIIVMTSNIGSSEMAKFAKGVSRIGFQDKAFANEKSDINIYKVAKQKAKKILPPELMGRIGHIEVFRPLKKEQLRDILNNKLKNLAEDLNNSPFPIKVIFNELVRSFVLNESCDHPEEGARLVEKKIRDLVRRPIETMVESGQIKPHDYVYTDIKEGDTDSKPSIIFWKKP